MPKPIITDEKEAAYIWAEIVPGGDTTMTVAKYGDPTTVPLLLYGIVNSMEIKYGIPLGAALDVIRRVDKLVRVHPERTIVVDLGELRKHQKGGAPHGKEN